MITLPITISKHIAKQEQTQQIADCTSNKQHKNCGNKIINGYLKKNRKKQLEKLFY